MKSKLRQNKAKRFKKIKTISKDDEDDVTQILNIKLDNEKRYAHTAPCGYHLTMAILQPDLQRLPNCACSQINDAKDHQHDADRVVVIIEHNLKEHILCILELGKINQSKLNLNIEAGEQIAYKTIGKIPVILVGIASEPMKLKR